MRNNRMSFLDELDKYVSKENRVRLTENKSDQVLHAAINLVSTFDDMFDEETAEILTKTFLLSIKRKDQVPFQKAFKKAKKRLEK